MVKKSNTQGNTRVAENMASKIPKSLPCLKRQYKGVRMRSWGSWVSEIRAPNHKTRIWLGSYSTPEAAARAYDAALLCLKGSSATLNFPITPSPHLPDTLMSPKSIQKVAAAAAATSAPQSSPPPPIHPSLPSDFQNEIIVPVMMDNAEEHAEGQARSVDPWIDLGGLQSPKYADQMLNAFALFATPATEECDEEGDIRLWSFC